MLGMNAELQYVIAAANSRWAVGLGGSRDSASVFVVAITTVPLIVLF